MERIHQKIGRIREYMNILQSFKLNCAEKMKDPVTRGAILHYLYLMADTCIVLAEMVIKEEKLRPPQSYAECFDILGEQGILEKEFAYAFAGIAGFRNFLAHDYDRVNYVQICETMVNKLDEVERYLKQIEAAL